MSAAGMTWVRVCALETLVPDRGAAALVNERQVALFRLSDEAGSLHAIGHRDPYSGANVMARGLVGSVGDVAVVVSPMHKQRFRFDTGGAIDDPTIGVGVWATRVVEGFVEVGAVPVVEPNPAPARPVEAMAAP